MFKVHPSFLVFAWCVGCGDSFTAGGSGGASAVAGAAEAGASARAGSTSSGGSANAGVAGDGDPGGAGTASGGVSEQGGSVASAGSSAGSVASAGSVNHAGNGGTGNGGSGNGGAGKGGSAGSTGSAGAGGADCEALKKDYQATLDKARVCSSGSTDQCSPSSTLPGLGCGCPVLVNSKSEQTAAGKRKYQALEAAHCVGGVICLIACQNPTAAACAPESTTVGAGFVCTAGID